MLLLTTLSLLSSPAHAASCTTQLGKIESLSPEAVAPAFADLVKCDRKIAEANFEQYLKRATEVDALVALVMAAVDGDVWNPAWTALGKISSYDARDEVAERVGEMCGDHPKVVNFLQGAYFGQRNVEFQQWDDAFPACPDDALWSWAEGQVKSPPPRTFDEKYSTLVGIYVKKLRGDALPVLAEATVKAVETGGPFEDLLRGMSDSVQPQMGREIVPADQAKLVEALVGVAQKVPVEQASQVAGELANAGAEGAAASLLPKLYPDRVQGGGGFLYAAGTIEAGDCGGKKTAVFHYGTATDAGKRWAILGDLEPLAREAKPKLKGCTVEEPWPVVHSPEPIKNAGEADAWAATLVKEWEGKGYEVKTQKEKPIALP